MMHAAGARNDRTRSDRPRFRQDLFAELIEEQGARFIDVMDPDRGTLFRFYEVEYSLACAMDGERDVPGIVKWAQDELGLTPSQNEVRAVIQTLGDLGFIDAEAGAAQAASPELAPGVVAGTPAAFPPTDVALGAAGTTAPARSEPAAPAPQVALGTPGAPKRRPSEPVEEVALGTPGRSPARPAARPTPAPQPSEVSIDLADHIEVRRDDVKEAVRASKIMTAVELPQDLLDAGESQPKPPVSRPPEPVAAKPASRPPEPVATRPEPVAAKPEPVAARPEPVAARPEPVAARPEPVAARPEPVAAKPDPVVSRPPEPAKEPARPVVAKPEPVGKPPVELPRPPVHVDKPTAPPAPRSRISPVLIVLLILVVIGGGGFAFWQFYLQKNTHTTTDAPTSGPPLTPPPAPPPPAAPAAPTAKLSLVAPPADDVTALRAGVIETILTERTVKSGDVLVRLQGDRPIESALNGLAREEKQLQDQLAAATRKRDAAQGAARTAADADVTERARTLAAKQDQIKAKKTELAAFVIIATADGAFTPSAKNNQKVAADDIIAKLQRDPAPTATFKLTDLKPFAANSPVDLVVGKGDQHVSCTVAEVQADGLKVNCPADPSLTDGTDVTLLIPGTAPAAGSATGSAAPAAGSAAPAAGSAEAPSAGSAAVPAGAAGSAAVPAAGSAAAPAEAPAGSAK